MTGMTPERLDAIRANLPAPDADLSRRERDALDLLDEVDRLRHENADLRRSRDKRKATERQRRTEDREAWARARDAEVRADERAKVLAGFTEERGLRTPGGVDLRLTPNVRDIDIDPPPPGLTLTRRLVGPWEPTP